jgi:serine protease Do
LSDVFPETPAFRAGIKAGDIVLSLDGKLMENARQLQVNLYGRAVGDTVRLEIQRGSQTLAILVAVAERDDDPTRFTPLVSPDEPYVERLGILGLTLDTKAAALLSDLRISSGIVVAATSMDLVPNAEGQLKPGDLIHALNGTPMKAIGELRAAVERLKVGDAVVLQVERDGELLYVALRVER